MDLLSRVFGKSNKDKLRESLIIIRAYFLKYPNEMMEILDNDGTGLCCYSREEIQKAILKILSQSGLNTKCLINKYPGPFDFNRPLSSNYKAFVYSINRDLKDLLFTTTFQIEWAIKEILESNSSLSLDDNDEFPF